MSATLESRLTTFFQKTPLVAALCEHGGWPDTETLDLQIDRSEDTKRGQTVFCHVTVQEILMLGCGGIGERVSHRASFLLHLDDAGQVREAQILYSA